MPAPAVMSGVPPGLEYLSQIDQLLVNQQIELLEGGLLVLVCDLCVCVCVCTFKSVKEYILVSILFYLLVSSAHWV